MVAFFRTFLTLSHGIPSRDTFLRVVAVIPLAHTPGGVIVLVVNAACSAPLRTGAFRRQDRASHTPQVHRPCMSSVPGPASSA
jgi:hypothetical protein